MYAPEAVFMVVSCIPLQGRTQIARQHQVAHVLAVNLLLRRKKSKQSEMSVLWYCLFIFPTAGWGVTLAKQSCCSREGQGPDCLLRSQDQLHRFSSHLAAKTGLIYVLQWCMQLLIQSLAFSESQIYNMFFRQMGKHIHRRERKKGKNVLYLWSVSDLPRTMCTAKGTNLL